MREQDRWPGPLSGLGWHPELLPSVPAFEELDVCRDGVDLGGAQALRGTELFAPGGHDPEARVGDRLGHGLAAASVKPDAVGDVGSPLIGVAQAFGTMAGGTVVGENRHPRRGKRGVMVRTRKAERVFHHLRDLFVVRRGAKAGRTLVDLHTALSLIALPFHLLLTIFYYEDNFEEAFRLARSRGIRPFLIVKHMQDILDQAPQPFRDAVAGYLEENQQELFETRADCVAWAQENYDDLISGELGGNLLSKYSMIGRFIVLDEALDFLKRAISDLLDKDDHEAHEMLDTIINYYSAVMLHVPFSETLEHEPVWSSSFDVEAWRNSGYQGVLQDYQFDAPREFQTQVDQRVKTTLLSRIETFGEHASGLGRFTRTMFANDFRRNFVSGESQHAAE